MHHHPWKKLSEHFAYNGWRNIIRKAFELPNGQRMDFDILGAGHYVTVAAVTETGEFILVSQYRPGPEQMLVSFPEGAIDSGEKPEEAARRELLEETGYEAGEITFLKEFRSSYTNQYQYCLLATGCRPTGRQQLDDDEFIEVFTLPPSDFRRLLGDTADTSFHNVGCGYLALEKLGLLCPPQSSKPFHSSQPANS